APWAGVPLPGGSPVPSGSTWSSHAASSAGLIGCPSRGPRAYAASAAAPSAIVIANAAALCLDMLQLPAAVARPAQRAGVGLRRKSGHGRRLGGLPAVGHDFGARRLRVAGLVPGAALQQRRATVPAPRHAKAGERLGEHGFLQRRLRPGLSAVGRDRDLRDPP